MRSLMDLISIRARVSGYLRTDARYRDLLVAQQDAEQDLLVVEAETAQ